MLDTSETLSAWTPTCLRTSYTDCGREDDAVDWAEDMDQSEIPDQTNVYLLPRDLGCLQDFREGIA